MMKSMLAAALLTALGANGTSAEPSVRLITLDPGHFHAALVQKFMYPQVDPTVNVYAPAGDDLVEHLKRIEGFNRREKDPTRWAEKVHESPDFLERMLAEKPGNVVVLSGNNARKTDYILWSVQAGLNVLADKPMAIDPTGFAKLQQAFAEAAKRGVLLYDIMTERSEITTILQRELSREPEVFGTLKQGTPEEPGIEKISVHHYSKEVAGVPLKRPQWFFDVRQQGEGIVDVTTHLVDLIQWEAFPDTALDDSDVKMLTAKRWTTPISPEQFKNVTGADKYPDYLRDDVDPNGVLQVYGNGAFVYTLRGVHAKVSVTWKFEAPPGGKDTHFSIMRGTRANLIIRQGPEQKFHPELSVEKIADETDALFETKLRVAVDKLQSNWPGVCLRRDGTFWTVVVPEKYDIGHEAHFAQVTERYLKYLAAGKLPDWEVPNMIVKYGTIMKAYELSRSTKEIR